MSDHTQNFRVLAFRPAHARRILLEVAQRYARLWLVDTATVRDAPVLTAAERERLADYRWVLENACKGELPMIAEPGWPVRLRMSDWTTGPKGFAKAKKGARKAPTWTNQTARTAADEWAASLVDQVMGPGDGLPTREQWRADQANMLRLLGQGGGPM